MNVPFAACIGVDIEELVYARQEAEAARFFRQAMRALDQQSKIILFIPQGILDCAEPNSHLKAFCDALAHMSQAKVVIGRNAKRSCDWTTNAHEGYNVTSFLQGQVQRRELPFTIGLQNSDIVKEACEPCQANAPCHAEMTFCAKQLDTAFVADLNAEQSEFVKAIAEQALNSFYHKFSLDANTHALLSRLLFIREGLNCAALCAMDQVHISNAFFGDVNNVPVEDKWNIVLSAARAFCYPPVRDPARRDRGSLDWHEDQQVLPGKAVFYRADVVSGLQTGLQNSGAKRLLFGRRHGDGKMILFGYTPAHDFSRRKLQTRWEDAEKELKQ